MRYESMHQPLRDHVNEAPCRAEAHAGSGSHTRLLLHFSRLFILPLRAALFSLEAGVVGSWRIVHGRLSRIRSRLRCRSAVLDFRD
jgi:hypothetical protein